MFRKCPSLVVGYFRYNRNAKSLSLLRCSQSCSSLKPKQTSNLGACVWCSNTRRSHMAMARQVNVAVVDSLYINHLNRYYESIFKKSTPNVEVNFRTIPENGDMKEGFSDAEVILMSPHGLKISSEISKTTKWIQWTWAGVEPLMNEKIRRDLEGCIVTRAAGIFGSQMAEYAIGAVIAMERDLPTCYQQQIEKKWERPSGYRNLSTLSIGILGLGDIGLHIAKVCSQLGMTVYGLKKTATQCEHVEKVFTSNKLAELIKLSDYICNVLPSTPETKEIITEQMLESCSHRKSRFINIGRGDVVNEETLIKALKNGWLSGAFLDVFAEEPLKKSSPLWTIRNVVVTPHIAGRTYHESTAKLFFHNLEKYLKNEKLDYIVDFDAGY